MILKVEDIIPMKASVEKPFVPFVLKTMERREFPATHWAIDEKTGQHYKKYMPTLEQWLIHIDTLKHKTKDKDFRRIVNDGMKKHGFQKNKSQIYKRMGLTVPKNLDVQVGCGLTMLEYLNIFHDDTTGYITGSKLYKNGKWMERHYGSVEALMAAVNLNQNTYFSVNTTYRKQRAIKNLREITTFFVDLDIYNVKDGDTETLSKLKALDRIELGVKQGMFPRPTLVCDSGGGLYVFWKISHVPGKSSKVLQLWQQIMSVLLDNMEELGLGPDRKAKDATRMLRVMGTKNNKWNKGTKVLVYNEDAVYTLRELAKKWYPKQKSAKKKKTRQKSSGRKKGQLSHIFNSYSLNKARIADIETIIKHRSSKKIKHRNREVTLFIYRHLVSLGEGDEVALAKTLELNKLLINPLTEREIKGSTATSSSMREKIEAKEQIVWDGKEKMVGYHYSNTRLIEILELKQNEMKQMNLKTIISAREKYDRNNARRKSARRGEDGLTDTERTKNLQFELIQELKGHGVTQRAIAEQLEISLSTVKRYCKMSSVL